MADSTTQVTDAVHAQGSFIYLQLWATGRTGSPETLEAEGHFPYISSSDIPLSGRAVRPRALTVEGPFFTEVYFGITYVVPVEIREYIDIYATAAKSAIRAGFDGVEIHGAHGYLIDQFTQDTANRRTDEYGGSIEGRTKFVLDVVDSVCAAVGENKTSLRLSPWSDFQGTCKGLIPRLER